MLVTSILFKIYQLQSEKTLIRHSKSSSFFHKFDFCNACMIFQKLILGSTFLVHSKPQLTNLKIASQDIPPMKLFDCFFFIAYIQDISMHNRLYSHRKREILPIYAITNTICFKINVFLGDFLDPPLYDAIDTGKIQVSTVKENFANLPNKYCLFFIEYRTFPMTHWDYFVNGLHIS